MITLEPVDKPDHVPAANVVDFDMYHPPGGKEDLHKSWYELRESSPDIIWTPRNGGHWLVVGGHLIDPVLHDHEKFSARVLFVPKEMGELHTLIPTTMDPPQHRHYRNLLNHGLSPKAVKHVEPFVEELAIELIEEISKKKSCDFVKEYAEQLPIRIFMSIVDLPIEDAATIKYYADHTTRPNDELPYEDAIKGLADYLEPLVEARAGKDGEDLLSRLINGVVEGRSLTRKEAIQICSQILIAGTDTVVNALSFVMLYLAEHPELRKDLAQNPEKIPSMLDEIMRRFAMVITGREITQDCEFEGLQFKKGEMIVVPTQMHSLDSRINPDPLEVCPHRKNMSHSAFGAGAHRCPGAILAKTELRITLEEWLKRIPDFDVSPDQPITFSSGVVGCVDNLTLVWQ